MKASHRRAVLAFLALAGLAMLTAEASAQTSPPTKVAPAGEWKFDGSQWQYQENGGVVIPPKPGPGTPSSPAPGTTPSYPPGTTPVGPPGTTPSYPPSTTPSYPPGTTPAYPQPKPTPTYPGTAPSYPPNYTPTPKPPVYATGPTAKVKIGSVVLSYSQPVPPSTGLVVVTTKPNWVVRYKKFASEPWHYYATYGSSSAALGVATSLSQQGFWAGVSRKN
jgi:hypothetical protein